ncbi:MAG: type II toxin-antitoxin system YafQ family toxin [Streptococcaceae bacterium]|jgi:mRNA interferase YafQ|nr:type II toxin-antitoxin system YafQ family toxin [Streptococcaceae bacterium]
MVLDYRTTKKFDKDVKKLIKRNWKLSLLEEAMTKLLQEEVLGKEYKLHPLEPKNKIPKRWDIHLGGEKSDWIVVFYYEPSKKLIVFERTGTHSDIFR